MWSAWRPVLDKAVTAFRYPVGCGHDYGGGDREHVTEDVYLAAEARARVEIDWQPVACGWLVHDRAEMNLHAGQGVAVREFIMASGHGRSDHLLFVDGKAVGAIEAKPSGTPLAGVEPQTAKYAAGLPPALTAVVSPLPFLTPRWCS